MAQHKFVIVAVGEGNSLAFMGPFDEAEEAVREGEAWAADHVAWWIAPIVPPFDGEDEQVVDRVAEIRAPEHEPEW